MCIRDRFNEGYAQYFESCGTMTSFDAAELAPESTRNLLPALMMMDYEEFYSGSDEERLIKYRLAESIAFFIEHGAPEIRFAPFKNLKRDYIAALLECRDMRKATTAAFGSAEKLQLFIEEWKEFWEGR